MRIGIVIPLILLALAGIGLATLATVTSDRRRLAERVAANVSRGSSIAPVPTRASAAEVRIRTSAATRWRVPQIALRMPVDLPRAHVVSPVWVLLFTTAFAIMVGWAGHFLVKWWLSVADGIFMWVVLTRTIFGWELDRYRTKLLRQLPDTIHLVISATRAGLPVSESFRTVVQEMAEPTAGEFARIVDEMSVGVSADEALLNLHRRTGVTEYAIFAVTIGVQARSGGRLAETIGNLAETVRDRIAIYGKARSLSAEARTSALIMTVLPLITGGLLALFRPGYLNPLFYEPRGQNMLIIGIVTLVLGTLTMRQLIRGAVKD